MHAYQHTYILGLILSPCNPEGNVKIDVTVIQTKKFIIFLFILIYYFLSIYLIFGSVYLGLFSVLLSATWIRWRQLHVGVF